MKKAEGGSPIIDCKRKYHSGRRVFSTPCNLRGMNQYNRSLREVGRTILIDLYRDGTTLTSLGTQSANNRRIRFSNIKGYADVWHDVWIVPALDTGGETRSDSAMRYDKNMVAHRFNYLILKDAIKSSHFGHRYSDTLVLPRIGMSAFDQLQ